MSENNIYAQPRIVTDASECVFYHTMDVPGHGLIEAQWDLREGLRDYLGRGDFVGKRVLEVGTADGFLCFSMEKMGAEVIAYDLSEEHAWDIVPFSSLDHEQLVASRKAGIRKLNNGYWFSHRAFKSSARMVYGSVYSIPAQIGPVDISTFGCMLVHVRDPFLALRNALRLTRETVIITDIPPRLNISLRLLERSGFPIKLLRKLVRPSVQFLPDYRRREPTESWWLLPPETLLRFIGILGFEDAEIRYHRQKFMARKTTLFTIVGHRTKGKELFQ